MSAKIFISFASQDHRVAMTLCQALESRGFNCWVSSRDIEPGENFQVAIVRAIRQAKIMLLVFTANSNRSEEMNKELALASQSKLIVVPLRIEDVTPNEAFAYEFATRQWIDFFADWEFAIEQLAQRIGNATREAIVAAPAVAAPARPAPEVFDEPEAFDTPDLDDALDVRETAVAARARPRRTALYVGLSLAALAAVAIGLATPSLMRSKAASAQPRVMTALLPTAPPSALQRASVEVAPPAATAVPAAGAAEAADPDAAPVKVARKKKPKAVVAADDVPY